MKNLPIDWKDQRRIDSRGFVSRRIFPVIVLMNMRLFGTGCAEFFGDYPCPGRIVGVDEMFDVFSAGVEGVE